MPVSAYRKRPHTLQTTSCEVINLLIQIQKMCIRDRINWNKQFRSSRALQRFERWEKDRRPKCYNCGKRGHLQVDCWEKTIPREESYRKNWRSKAPEQHAVFTLDKTSGNLIVNGFAEVNQHHLQLSLIHI